MKQVRVRELVSFSYVVSVYVVDAGERQAGFTFSSVSRSLDAPDEELGTTSTAVWLRSATLKAIHASMTILDPRISNQSPR